ncbi:MAG: PaaI family thioesterase [Chloroflexi bacterium]|nr:MAG: PaaI family thioesterase [Chloroflexota bacterium]TMF38274.1 MAG: PaaI family thioesterase [Chloroflexota bacterium]
MSDQEATRTIQAVMPLAATLGIRAEVYSPDEVALSMDWSPSLCTANGILHGGVIMALADSAGAACAMLNLPEGASGTATIESKTNFVGAVSKGTVSATSTPLHRGGTTIVVETVVHAEAGKLVAKVTQTQLVLRR